MRGEVFVDSNIWLYLFDSDAKKKAKALSLLGEGYTISTQVLTENANVCLRKFKMSNEDVERHINNLIANCRVVQIQNVTVRQALRIHEDYGYSLYDSLIISAAVESGCNTLYSEDLHNGQLVYEQLRIVNPFLMP